MTTTEVIAKRLCDKMLQDNEAAQLGYFAATCEVMAADLSLTAREHHILIERAAKYREMQAKALEG